MRKATALVAILGAAFIPAEHLLGAEPTAGEYTTTSVITPVWWIAPITAILALIFAIVFFKGMMKHSEGSDRMKEIAAHVREGAMAYLRRQYKVVTVAFIILMVILGLLAYFHIQNPFVPIAF